MNRMARGILTAMAWISLAAGFCGPVYAQVGRQQGLVEPNMASEQELSALPHMNAALVKGILERRPFLSMKELDSFLAASLSKKQLTELYGKMFLHINLNSASADEIRMIPGAGNRMAREFQEYRPYDTIEKFRKEIGKYVNAKEVARLERYVTLE